MNAEEIDEKMKDRIFSALSGKDWSRAKNAKLWQSGAPHGGLHELASGCTPDWDWSYDFERWGASVVLSDGWSGFTFPWYE